MAGARRLKPVFSRKTAVKQLNEAIELLQPRGFKVLKMLGAGNPASQVAKTIGCSRPNITYWKNKLLRLGLLKIQVKDVYKI